MVVKEWTAGKYSNKTCYGILSFRLCAGMKAKQRKRIVQRDTVESSGSVLTSSILTSLSLLQHPSFIFYRPNPILPREGVRATGGKLGTSSVYSSQEDGGGPSQRVGPEPDSGRID